MAKKQRKSIFSKKLFFIFIFLILAICGYYKFAIYNQKVGLKSLTTISTDEINFYLNSLNQERFTDKSKKPIREFITKEFNKYGYKVTPQDTGKYINLIAEKENISDSHILIGAHYDTVADTVGMDDNASGVAALLAIAKHNQNSNIKFIAFDGEEDNLSGSMFYVKNISSKPELVVILETIGYYSKDTNSQKLPKSYNLVFPKIFNQIKSDNFKGNFSAAICSDGIKNFCQKYESYSSSLNLKVYSVYITASQLKKMPSIKDLFRSDHTPFLLENIPSVMITDTANFRTSNYHTPSDTLNTVNPEFIAKQANAILSILSVN